MTARIDPGAAVHVVCPACQFPVLLPLVLTGQDDINIRISVDSGPLTAHYDALHQTVTLAEPTEYEMWRDALHLATLNVPREAEVWKIRNSAVYFLGQLLAGPPPAPEPTPVQPPIGAQIRDANGDHWVRDTEGWYAMDDDGRTDGEPADWSELLEFNSPITVPLDQPEASERA